MQSRENKEYEQIINTIYKLQGTYTHTDTHSHYKGST